MDVSFRTRKLAKTCSSSREMAKTYGDQMGKLIGRRLAELEAASTLADLATLPQVRAHQLTGDRKGQISLDLVHPFRLILEVADDPAPKKKDGGLDWNRVTEVEVIEVTDPH